MADKSFLNDIDPTNFTTSERRYYLAQMQKYLDYFQRMQKRAKDRNVVDRVAAAIKIAETRRLQEKEQERIDQYRKLIRTLYEKNKMMGTPAAFPSFPMRGDYFTRRGVGAASAGGLFGVGCEIIDTVAGLSDKEQAVFYKKMCETLLGVVSAFRVPEEIVKQELAKTMKAIGMIKEKYKDLENEEEMAKRIQDECVVELTEGIEGSRDCEAFQEKVLDVLGENAWDHMSPNSQIFIVTAELLYEQWKIYEEGIDFAPICLSVSKALEVEVTRRYFIGFRDYLEKHHLRLPDEMYKKNGAVKEADDFLLGNLTGITGYAVYLDTQRVKLNNRFLDVNRSFLNYAKSDLMAGKSEAQCINIMKEHLLNIKNVCVNYRNPSAHKQKMNKVNARECLDYIIDVKRILGKMIDDCSW